METTPSLKIFLVDDEPYCLYMYRQFLANIGYRNVSIFDSEQDCLNSLHEKPGIIFLDYHMASVNGIDMLKKIKRVDPNALVVFISGQEEIPVAVNALKYGALDYMVKGQVNESRLRHIIGQALALRSLIESRKKNSFLRKLLFFKF